MRNEKLTEIQDNLNKNFIEYTKKEFDLHLDNYKEIQPFLSERKKIIEQIDNFWNIVLKNSEFGKERHAINFDFIDYLSVSYEDQFWCQVEIKLKPNKYVDQPILVKRFNVLTEEVGFTEFKFNEKTKCLLLNFFVDEEVDMDLFDSLYDLYVNAISYYYGDNY